MIRSLIPYLGKKTARQRLDEIFSRDMLGAVIVGSSFFKILENILNLIVFNSSDYIYFIALYLMLFIASVLMFAYWERIERRIRERTEQNES